MLVFDENRLAICSMFKPRAPDSWNMAERKVKEEPKQREEERGGASFKLSDPF